ncbi:cupin domain-containing protein [Natronomonas salsuginis]|uniref:Cupin domain-containing protein n=1 Tax=Natronomonas salsuginis TaxID=2217661 RepID=A0A4U5J7Y2_9EURY|nr:cupin domain-containing protein [Natronomonas salsuginis]TKR25190.1 cupin domain-containing protein [Natronomonas salsuginis]
MSVRRKQLGEAAGGEGLGCSLYELPSGEESLPYHYHTANEEAAYVLLGTGTLRLADETHRLTAGEYVAFPAGGSGGHKIANDAEEPLRCLVFSMINDPEVTVRPDSEKLSVFVESPPGGREERTIYGYYPMDSNVDYWEGK